MYVCIYIYIYIHTYVCVYIYIYIYQGLERFLPLDYKAKAHAKGTFLFTDTGKSRAPLARAGRREKSVPAKRVLSPMGTKLFSRKQF